MDEGLYDCQHDWEPVSAERIDDGWAVLEYCPLCDEYAEFDVATYLEDNDE